MWNIKNAEIIFANSSWVHKLRFRIFQVTAQLLTIFYVAFYSTFGSFSIINLNRSLIFNNGSRYGSVTWNMGQLIQV